MSSLKTDFNELMERIKQGREFGHASFEPIFYLVFPPSAAYTPAGDLDLDGYTCDDCVYVNTCPKVGQSTPKECGSFQWKSD